MQNERILMQGAYDYLCDGKRFAAERWTLRRRPEGFILDAEVERLVPEDWSIFPGSPLLNRMQIMMTREKRPATGDILLRFDHEELQGQYRFAIGGVQAIITRQDGQVSRHELLLPRGYAPAPQPISANLFIWRLFDPSHPEPQSLITYWINIFRAPHAPAPLLEGVRIDYTMVNAGFEQTVTPAGEFETMHLIQQYRNRGQELDQHGWFDESGITIRWAYEQGGHDWQYSLTEYQRSDETPAR